MAISSPINFKNISGSIDSLKKGLTRAKQSVGNIKTSLLNRTIFKKQSISTNKVLQNRREENIRRKDQEDILESTGITGIFKRAGSIVTENTKGFLGRILDFITTMLVGWLLYNLPTILAMVRDLIKRIQSLFSLMQRFILNIGNMFKDFGNILGAVLYNVTHLDFFDRQKKLENAMKGLESTFGDFNNQFEEGFKLFTTPLGEGEGEEPVPETGTDFRSPTGAGSMVGGSNEQKTMSFLISSGLTPEQASGVAGNIQQESGFRPNADNGPNGSNGSHYGIAQWDKKYRWPRVSAYIKSIGKDPNTLEGQLYGLVWESKTYGTWQRVSKSGGVSQASDLWLREFEKPGNYSVETPKRAKLGQDLYKKYKNYDPKAVPSTQLAQASTITQQYSSSGASGNTIDVGRSILDLGFTVGENKYFTNNTWSKFSPNIAGYNPKGNSPVGTHSSKDHGTNALDVTDWRGSEASGIPRLKSLFMTLYGQRQRLGIKALIFDPIGYWFSGYKNITYRPYGGHKNHLHVGFNAGSGAGSIGEMQRVQISSSSQPGQAYPEVKQKKRGQQVVVIDDRKPTQPQIISGGGGQESPQFIPENGLNSLIKMQMLLDLAYT